MNSPITPDSVESLAGVLREQHVARQRVALRGGQSHSPAPRDEIAVISMNGIHGIIAHEPEDLTVTVRAGTTIEELQTQLAKHGQWLPIEPPMNSASTIGGMIALGQAGPSRLRYGPVRDHIIAAQYIVPDGTIARSGSTVVKSVAGYDVHKMLVGSRGTLCAITEVTLRVAPLPEAQRLCIAPWHGGRDIDMAQLVRTSAPAYACVVGASLARAMAIGDEAMLAIRWDGYAADVQAQQSVAGSMLDRSDGSDGSDRSDRSDRSDESNDFAARDRALCQWNYGRKNLVRLTGDAGELQRIFLALHNDVDCMFDPASGVLDVDPGENGIASSTIGVTSATYAYRNAIVPGASRPSAGEQRIATRLKNTFDPHGIIEQWDLYAH